MVTRIETPNGPIAFLFINDGVARVWNCGSPEVGYLGNFLPFVERGAGFILHLWMERQGDGSWRFQEKYSSIDDVRGAKRDVSDARRARIEKLLSHALQAYYDEHEAEIQSELRRNARIELEDNVQSQKGVVDRALDTLLREMAELTRLQRELAVSHG